MSKSYDINALRRRKTLNVREQVAVARDDILREAMWWRNNPIPPAIRAVIHNHGFDVDSGILINVCDREYGLDDCADGTFVTPDGRFIEFDIELSTDGNTLCAVHGFCDVTDSLDICGHKPGVGATRPFLALDVLRELNADVCD